MKILIISQFAGSPDLGMVTRNYNWAVEFLKQGHDVTIIAASYSHYRNKHPDMGDKTIKCELIDGINYIWVKTPQHSGQSSLGRIKAMVSFHCGLKRCLKTLTSDFDAVIASSPQPFIVYPAHKFSQKCHAQFIYDIRDLWPLTLKEIGGMPAWHPFIMALQHAENYACRHADIVTAVPQNAKNYLMEHGMAASKFVHIGNGYIENPHPKLSHLSPSHMTLIKDLKTANRFIIGYCGTLGKANAMHTAIEAIKQTENKDIHLVIIGDGHQKSELESLALNLNVADRIHFLPPVPHDQIPDFLSLIDVAYIGSLYSKLYEYGASPAKMNDYMIAAKPILYAIGDPNNPVEQSGCGVSCRAENVKDIANAMDSFNKMTDEERAHMGATGKKWLLGNQTVEKQVSNILAKLQSR